MRQFDMKSFLSCQKVCALFWIAPLTLLAIIVSARFAAADGDDKRATTKVAARLLREGARLEQQSVTCRASNDVLLVELDNGEQSIEVLRNLAAQRILQACQEDASDCAWTVSGKITEFKGLNYILLDHVKRTPRSLR